MTEWKDIGSAPRDISILGYWPRKDGLPGGHMDRIWWDHHFEATEWDEEADEMGYRGAWSAGRVASWGYEEYCEEIPTHWMPLPTPPEASCQG